CGREIWPEKGGARPDDLWFEPRGRSEAGTCRSLQREGVPSDSSVAQYHRSRNLRPLGRGECQP
ncbi:MAG: hypothetical protein Q6K92_04590, partial [Thermostichus sp. DG_1_5_bins_95]